MTLVNIINIYIYIPLVSFRAFCKIYVFFKKKKKKKGDGILKKIYEETKNLSPLEKAKYLEESKDLASVHSEYSVKGQTTVSEADDDVDLHFICYIQKDGDLYELDGRKEFPINHGKCDDLLKVIIIVNLNI